MDKVKSRKGYVIGDFSKLTKDNFPKVLEAVIMNGGWMDYPERAYKNLFISEETLQQLAKDFAGKPLIIEHEEFLDDSNWQDIAVGFIGRCWVKGNDLCCDMIVADLDSVVPLLQKGWGISTQYDVDKLEDYESNGKKGAKLIKASPTGVAFVDNPRYTDTEMKIANKKIGYVIESVENARRVENMGTEKPKKNGLLSIFNSAKKASAKNKEPEGNAIQVGDMLLPVDIALDLIEMASKDGFVDSLIAIQDDKMINSEGAEGEGVSAKELGDGLKQFFYEESKEPVHNGAEYADSLEKVANSLEEKGGDKQAIENIRNIANSLKNSKEDDDEVENEEDVEKEKDNKKEKVSNSKRSITVTNGRAGDPFSKTTAKKSQIEKSNSAQIGNFDDLGLNTNIAKSIF